MYYNVCGERRVTTIEGCFCSYSLYFASLIRDESRTERRAMVLEAANGGRLCHPGSGRGCPPSCEQHRSPEESSLKGSYFYIFLLLKVPKYTIVDEMTLLICYSALFVMYMDHAQQRELPTSHLDPPHSPSSLAHDFLLT